jgi:filamentous hemagglutinin family protein
MLLAGTALCAPVPLFAQAPAPNTLPQGGAVIAGQASIATTAPNRMQVTQGSDRAVIGWQSFSIGSNAAVDIRQPGAGSISVQQVQGNDPSRIFGQLSSNGRVVVANPNGVWFGPDARVDAAGIAAGAGRMSQGAVDQFMADGRVRLDQGAATGAQVVNEGRITAGRGGLAALVGPTARNAGTIEAQGGRVQVAGASGATVDFDGDGLIALRAAPGALAENTGRIIAEGGRVRLSVAEAKGVLAGAVNLGGVVEARSVMADGGGITLGSVQAEGPAVTVTGRVDVSGPRGGSVTLLGDQVTVRDGARIDASGAAGGGTVRVGGDLRGAPDTRTARTTTVERGATLAADATTNGHGGTVVVWADGVSTMEGTITARGAGAGAGGFAEVSGLGGLAYTGTADLRAPSGLWGTLLFDPTTINIVASGGTNTIPGPATPGVVDLNASAVVAQLGLSNVELVATSAINVNAAVTWSTAGDLTLRSGNTVTVAQPVTTTGTGSLVILATTATVNNVTTGAPPVQIPTIVASGGGNVTIVTTGNTAINGRVDLAGASALSITGNNVSVGATGQILGTGSGAVTLAANTNVSLAGQITMTGASPVTIRADADDNGTGAANLNSAISLTSGALYASGASVRVGGSANMRVGTTTGAVTLEATGGTVEIASTGTLRNTRVESDSGPIAVIATQDVLVRGTGSNGTWSRIQGGGTVTVTAGGNVTLQAGPGTTGDNFARIVAGTGMTVTAGGNVTVGTGSGAGTAVSTGTSLESNSGTQTITAGGNVTVRAGGTNAASFIRSGGNQAITAGGTIDVTGAGSAARITAAGTQTVLAGGAVTLTGGTGPGFTASIANAGGAQAVSGSGVIVRANGGEAFVANTGGPQAVTATAGAVTLTAAAGSAATIRNAGGDQAVSGTAVTLAAAVDGPAAITNTGGAQTVTARTGAISLAAATNAPARITNDGGPQAVTAATTLTLAAAAGTGTAAITNGAGGQTVTGTGGITLAGAEAAAVITAGDDDQTVRSNGAIRLVASAAGTASGPLNAAITNGLGTQTVAAGGSLEVLAGGTNAGAAIRSGRDQSVTAGGRIDLTARDATADLTASGTQSITAGGAITLAGGTGPGFAASIANAGGSQAVSGQRIELAANAGGAAVTNRGGDQAVTATQLLNIAGGAGNGLVANDGGDQTVRADTGILLLAANNGGAVAIDNIGGNQTVAAGNGLITLAAATDAPAFIGNLGGDQTVTAATSVELAAAAGTRGQAAIFNDTGAQAISAGSDLSLTGGAGGAAFVIALGGPQTVTAGGLLTLTGAPGATPLGLSDAAPTAAPTPGSASIQSDPRTPPGVAAGTADQRVSAVGVIFAGPAGTSAIGLQDYRAASDSPAAAPRYQSVLSGGAELSVAGSTTVFALTPPPGPPGPPGGGGTGTIGEGTLDAAVNALRQILAPTFPRPVAEQLGGGTGGFVPAGLAEEAARETVEIAGEDPAAVFANAVLTTRVEGLLPPPVPYFPGFVSPPPTAATLR